MSVPICLQFLLSSGQWDRLVCSPRPQKKSFPWPWQQAPDLGHCLWSLINTGQWAWLWRGQSWWTWEHLGPATTAIGLRELNTNCFFLKLPTRFLTLKSLWNSRSAEVAAFKQMLRLTSKAEWGAHWNCEKSSSIWTTESSHNKEKVGDSWQTQEPLSQQFSLLHGQTHK